MRAGAYAIGALLALLPIGAHAQSTKPRPSRDTAAPGNGWSAPAPPIIAGIGAGPAWPHCRRCDLPLGVGVRGFALLVPVMPLAIGLTATHGQFGSKSAFTFVGPELELSSGFGRTWQLELWLAVGSGTSAVSDCGGSGGTAAEVGIRLGRRITSRTRVSLSVSASDMGHTDCLLLAGDSGSTGDRRPAYVEGTTLVLLDFAYDVVAAR